MFPISTATVSEMIRKQTGLNAVDEVQLSLRAGEGIGALLRRGGYDRRKSLPLSMLLPARPVFDDCKLVLSFRSPTRVFGLWPSPAAIYM